MEQRKRLGLLAVLVGLTMALMPLMASGATEHCPGHNGHPGKVESKSDGDLDDIVLPAGTVFCVKGATGASGQITSDGVTPIGEYLPLNGGQTPNVSYYVVYDSTTTTAPEDTTTTTVAETTTTTTVAETTTTTTVAETTTTAALPFTGIDTGWAAVAASSLMLGGLVLLARARRFDT